MRALNKLLNLVFPMRCIYCNRLSEELEHGFCHDCHSSLSIFLRNTGFTWYVFDYDKKIAKILIRAKFGQKPGIIKNMSGLLAELLQKEGIKADLVIPVPMFRKDIGKRGYNQSSIAASRIARDLGISFKDKALQKIKSTKRQSDLSKTARSSNLIKAFRADADMIKGKTILLVDDIMTTGSTLNECRRTLLLAGASKVEAAVIAYTPLKKHK